MLANKEKVVMLETTGLHPQIEEECGKNVRLAD